MRVATYTQPTAVTRGSLAALSILIATIVLGTTVASTLAEHFAPALSGLVTFGWMGLYVLAFLGLMFGQGINWISWLVRYRILFVLLLLGSVLTVAWSIDSRVSAERVVHLFGACLLGIYFGFTIPLLTTLRVLGVVLGIIMIASIGAALALPELGITAYEGQLVWSGVMNSKNHLGFWAATGVLLYVALSDSTHSFLLRLICYVMAGLCLALLAFSHSATSLLAMLVGGALSTYLYIANRFQLGFVRMVVLAVLFTALVGFAAANIDTAELVGRTDDLTGRGEVWKQTWQLIMERPLGGYGYGALWFPTADTLWIQQSLTDFTWIVHHAHNGFLQVASEIGLPLALFAILMVAQQMVEIIYCQYQRQQVGTLFVLAFVVAFLIGNFSEARFLVTRELYWILFVALPISMLRQVNVMSTEEASAGTDAPDLVIDDNHPFARPDGGPPPEPERPSLGSTTPPSTAFVKLDAPLGDDDELAEHEQSQGWGRDRFDGTDEFLDDSSGTDIDLGDADLDDVRAELERDRDATQVLTPDDWIAGSQELPGLGKELPADRFDKPFDPADDGDDDWIDVPLDGIRR